LDEAEKMTLDFTSMARRLTSVNDVSIGGDTTFDGSILIDGEVPAGLAQLLKEVHKEGVTVMHLAEQQEKQQEQANSNSDAILVHLQRLQEVLTSKDSNETIVGLFKDFEQNINSDRENMLKEIKKFAQKVETTTTVDDSNFEMNNVDEIVNRLENIASKLQNSNSIPGTPRKNNNVQDQFQQVSPNRVVNIEEFNMLQSRFTHLQQRMEAVSLAKPEEQTILESFRQRIVSSLANINILISSPVSQQTLSELDQSRMEINSIFEELQKFNIVNVLNSEDFTNNYLKKCNKELTDRCCLIESKARRISSSVSDLEVSIRNYQKKCAELKNKAKNSTYQANTLYNKLVRSDQYKRALGFQKRYFLMRLESESTKIDLAMQIVNDLINDLPEYMRNKYTNQFSIIKRGLTNGRSPIKNKPILGKYSSRSNLNMTEQAKKKRARRNWRVLIITARATARMKILCRRSIRTKVSADQKFNLSQFEDEDDLIYDFEVNRYEVPMNNVMRSPRVQQLQFQRSNSEHVGVNNNNFIMPTSPVTSFGNQNAFGGSMVVHNSPVNRQLFQSHTGLNNLGNSTATTVTPIRENIDWTRQRGPSAGIVDNAGISHNSTPGRLSTGLTDYQNLTSHHYSNSNLVNHQQNINNQTNNNNSPFTPTSTQSTAYTNLQAANLFPNSYSTQNF